MSEQTNIPEPDETASQIELTQIVGDLVTCAKELPVESADPDAVQIIKSTVEEKWQSLFNKVRNKHDKTLTRMLTTEDEAIETSNQ